MHMCCRCGPPMLSKPCFVSGFIFASSEPRVSVIQRSRRTYLNRHEKGGMSIAGPRRTTQPPNARWGLAAGRAGVANKDLAACAVAVDRLGSEAGADCGRLGRRRGSARAHAARRRERHRGPHQPGAKQRRRPQRSSLFGCHFGRHLDQEANHRSGIGQAGHRQFLRLLKSLQGGHGGAAERTVGRLFQQLLFTRVFCTATRVALRISTARSPERASTTGIRAGRGRGQAGSARCWPRFPRGRRDIAGRRLRSCW
jgi:hypothetical protein